MEAAHNFVHQEDSYQSSVWTSQTDVEDYSPSRGWTRSECWEALQVQTRAAEATKSFVFAHRRLDGVAALALTQYLRDDCKARFVDLSFLGAFDKASLAAAGALEKGLRSLRSLTLDNNDLGSSPDVLDAWCHALEEHPGIQHVSLRNTQIDDEGAERVAKALGQSLLFSLDLSCNNISDSGLVVLTQALASNNILLELLVEGTNTSEEARAALEEVLRQNRGRYRGPSSVQELLNGLRKARAEAITADAKLANSATETLIQGAESPRKVQAIQATSAAVSDLQRGASFYIPPEDVEAELTRQEPSAQQSAADAVWFDGADGTALLRELTLRCEAGWRHNAADQDRMLALRRLITELQGVREHERERHEEALQRIAAAQADYVRSVEPLEQRIAELREDLDAKRAASGADYVRSISLKVELRAAEDGLELAREELAQRGLAAQKFESGLKLRYHDAAEKAQQLEADIGAIEDEIERLAADNERCRRSLHALRFETETERFVPHAVLERLAQNIERTTVA
mmetsp:Transcript_16795/g.29473  ORF Transcript_16795/g.29473 Transcript_16795/m.29473 type:complete len:519 (-) Transcript_16795:75-1631(-)